MISIDGGLNTRIKLGIWENLEKPKLYLRKQRFCKIIARNLIKRIIIIKQSIEWVWLNQTQSKQED